MVNPKRIILSDRHRTDNITLFNSGSDTSSFRISLVHYEMREDGSLEEIPDSITTYRSTYCDSLVSYFPLQVTLGPHESQAVHLRFVKPMNLAPGEYRSHMYFRSVERAKPLEAQTNDSSERTISLDLRPVFGLSIPVIVRNQTSPDVLSIDSVHISSIDSSGNGTITALLHRSGNESCYGSLVVYYKDPHTAEAPIGLTKGVAVYVPLPDREVSVSFTLPRGANPTKGIFRLEYQTLTDNPKEQVLAKAEIRMGQ